MLLFSLLLAGCSDQDAAQPVLPPRNAQVDTAAVPPAMDGRMVFEHWCLPCHAAGPGHPGTNRLAERLGAERSVILERGNLGEEYIKVVVRNGFQMMPPFRETEISDSELAAVAAYVASSDMTPVQTGRSTQ